MIRSPAGFDGGDRIKRYLDYYQPSYGVMMLSAGQFSPASLFAQGEQGVWYDPSDFSTLFQDSAGTTPVTAVEQPVGRILDKSGRGNHATQSTSAARPVLSARVNLLTKTEQFDDAVWTKIRSSAANTTATTDPIGGNTADKLAEDTQTGAHYVANAGASFTFQATSYTWSCYIKAAERGFAILGTGELGGETGLPAAGICIDLSTGTVTATNGTFSSQSVTAVGNGWYRAGITVLGTAATGRFWVAIAQNGTSASVSSVGYTGNGTSGIYIWGADLRVSNVGVNLPVYQRVNTATDYDTTGFPYYLRFDGSDDSMATATINPGSVDKAQVFAGVRKLSDAAGGVVMELSNSPNAANGTFTFNAPGAATPDYFWRSRGTLSASSTTAASYPAPLTSVMTGIGDISGDVARLRYNGTQILNITTDQGTGNYGSYPLYIGSRGGTSLRFNGQLYSLIVRFSATNLPDATIAQTETWVNGKTGAY